jgi:hypothetical protein
VAGRDRLDRSHGEAGAVDPVARMERLDRDGDVVTFVESYQAGRGDYR